jgi:dTDP-4-amino-4,6-dideoxygalactose transaminase
MVQVARPYFRNRERILERISGILESGRLMNGEQTAAFEREFARSRGSRHAASVNSCTTALEITLRHLGVKGGEVIVPVNTFIATGNAVIFAGGRPVFADVKEGSYNTGIHEVEERITDRTRAVIAVHIAGMVCEDILEIRRLCDEKGIPLIEDCAHAVGATFRGREAGTFGFAGCFSFYPTKIITTGTGGMIATGSDELDAYARSVRIHGGSEKGTSEIINLGNDWFMDEIRAAIGLQQLEDLGFLLGRRREVARAYLAMIRDLDGLSVFPLPSGSSPAYYKFPVQVAPEIDVAALKRRAMEEFRLELESLYWPTCHLQPLYRDLFGFREGDFPVAEGILSRQVCLPIHGLISEEDINQVGTALRRCL